MRLQRKRRLSAARTRSVAVRRSFVSPRSHRYVANQQHGLQQTPCSILLHVNTTSNTELRIRSVTTIDDGRCADTRRDAVS